MVVPPLDFPDIRHGMTKAELRTALRAARRAEADALPAQVRALVFHRPPAPLDGPHTIVSNVGVAPVMCTWAMPR